METTQKTTLLPKGCKQEGLSWPVAAIFIAGEVIGSGLIVIPYSIASTSYAGFGLLAIFAVVIAICAILLGNCWSILQERYEEYKEKPTKNPFSSIGFRAYGNPGRYTVSIVNNIVIFGTAVVLMLITSQILQSLVIHLHLDLSFCLWLLVVAGITLPLSFLGTPTDLTPVAVVAFLSAIIASVILTVEVLQIEHNSKTVTHRQLKVKPFLMAFGVIAFSFSGNYTFPTIQHDMKEPTKFSWSVVLAFTIMNMLVLPVSVSGFVMLGDNLSENILDDISKYRPGPMLYIVYAVMMVHYIMALLIVLNPLFQEVEDLLKAPHKFHWKRVVIRTLIIVICIFVAETIPRFSAVMALLGGSAISIQIFIFPPLFYLRLKSIEHKHDEKPSAVPRLTRLGLALIMIIGLFCGCCATYNAITVIVEPNSFVLPCFLRKYLNTTSN